MDFPMANCSFIHHLRFSCRALMLEGHCTEQLLAGSGLTAANLEEIYGLATAEQFQTVFKNYMDLSGQQVSFQLANQLQLSDLGPLGYLLLSCETLKEALQFLHEFSPLVGPLLRLEGAETQDNYHLTMHCLKNLEPRIHRYTVEYLITALDRSLSLLSRRPISPKRIQLMHSDPGIKGTFTEISHVSFDQPQDSLTYDLQSLQQALPFSDPEMKSTLLALCHKLLDQINREITITDQVESIFSKHSGDYPDLATTASRLGISPRTLRRRLADENSSFHALIANHRKHYAQTLLQRDHLTIQTIAYTCGFSEVQNFSSAFKRWTGLSPSQYRTQLQ